MEQLWKKIAGLDLRSVRHHFSASKSWWWHVVHRPRQIENEYRQFLFFIVSNPTMPIVPWSQNVNDFWRQHLLEKRKYAADCQVIADRLIPYARFIDWSDARAGAMEETRKIYLSTFGESARQRRKAAGETWNESETAQVYSDDNIPTVHSHGAKNNGWHSHTAHHSHGNHAGTHHAGQHLDDHGGGGHHSCGGHSGCGGHGH